MNRKYFNPTMVTPEVLLLIIMQFFCIFKILQKEFFKLNYNFLKNIILLLSITFHKFYNNIFLKLKAIETKNVLMLCALPIWD